MSAGSGAIWIAWHAKKKPKNNCKQMTHRIYILHFSKKKWKNSTAACGFLNKEYTLRAEEERQTFDKSKENDRQGLEKL